MGRLKSLPPRMFCCGDESSLSLWFYSLLLCYHPDASTYTYMLAHITWTFPLFTNRFMNMDVAWCIYKCLYLHPQKKNCFLLRAAEEEIYKSIFPRLRPFIAPCDDIIDFLSRIEKSINKQFRFSANSCTTYIQWSFHHSSNPRRMGSNFVAFLSHIFIVISLTSISNPHYIELYYGRINNNWQVKDVTRHFQRHLSKPAVFLSAWHSPYFQHAMFQGCEVDNPNVFE